MLLEWRTRTVGGVPAVDIRITRESDDIWCFNEVESRIDSSWSVRVSAGPSSVTANVGAAVSYDAANEIITLTYANVPGRYLAILTGQLVGVVDLFRLTWDPRQLRPSAGGSYVAMASPETYFDTRIYCDPPTNSPWGNLAELPRHIEASTNSSWGALVEFSQQEEETTNSLWGALAEFPRRGDETTNSEWGTLAEFSRQGQINNPPEWNLPAAINVGINDDAIINLLDYCFDPDGDSLTFTANENSANFSINLSGSMLTINGGPNDRRPAGIISLTASDGQATIPDSVPVNVLDLSRNAAPMIIAPAAPFPSVIIDGGSGRLIVGDQFTATDSDGDTIPTWDADPPNLWRVESQGPLSVSTTPDAHQTGFVQLSAIEDYFNRSTIYSNSLVPEGAIWSVRYRVRCRDNRRAWSNYEDSEISALQPVHGSNENVDSFEERPDRRQPNIWAFKKGATTAASLGGISYQYTTPDAARADKANWVGSIRYAARRLYNLIQGTRPSVVVHGIRSVHSSLNAVLETGGDVVFTVKPDAPASDRGEYSSGYQWTILCQVLIDGGGGGNPDFWETVSGFLFIEDAEPVAITAFANGRDVERLTVVAGTRVTFTWETENAVSLTLQIVEVPNPVEFPLDGSFSTVFNTPGGSVTLRFTATGTSGDTAFDDIVITIIEATTNSPWGQLDELPRTSDTTDSQWGALAEFPREAETTDSQWGALIEFERETTDSEWGTLVELEGATTNSEWGTLVEFVPLDVNRPPRCSGLPEIVIAPFSADTIDITNYLFDPDGDDITISLEEPIIELPVVSVTSDDTSPDIGETVTISWSIAGDYISNVEDPFGGTSLSGTSEVTRRSAGSIEYSASATNPAGTSIDSVTVRWSDSTPPPSLSRPTVSISADDTSPDIGETVTISWSISGRQISSITNPDGTQARSGSIEVSRNTVGGNTYRVSATNPAGTSNDSVNVQWSDSELPPRPTVSINADDTSLETGNQVRVTWSASNADSVSVRLDGTEISTSATGSHRRTQQTPRSIVFSIQATNSSGTSYDSVTVTWTEAVIPPPPTVSISASTTSPDTGEFVTISWSISGEDILQFESPDGTLVGSIRETSGATTSRTYSVLGRNRGGTSTDSVTVRWQGPVPGVSLSATPSNPTVGQTVAVSWSTSNAQTVSFRQNGVEISSARSGRVSRRRNEPVTWEYYLFATNSFGSNNVTISVTWSAARRNTRQGNARQAQDVETEAEVLSPSRHTIGITSGTPGEYEFDVYPTDEHGLTGDPCSLSIIVEQPTETGEWASIITNPTRDGRWSEIIASPTLDGEWAPVYGPPVYDGGWSELIFLQSPFGTVDGAWAAFVTNPTGDGPWSPVYGPPVVDGEWSGIVFLATAVLEDSEWSALSNVAYRSRGSRERLITGNGAWSAVGNAAYIPRLSPVSGIAYQGPWSVLSNAAYRPRRPAPQTIPAHSSWSAVSSTALRPRVSAVRQLAYRSSWPALSNAAYFARADAPIAVVYHGVWQFSNTVYSPRQRDIAPIIGSSAWSSVSNVSFRPRVGPLTALVYAEWSNLSNTAYRPRAGPPALILYRSKWSPVSNVARQEREVLSAIGGAIPFLHIYEARRGLVQVRRLVDYATGDLFAHAGFEEAAVNADRDDDRVIINPGITLLDLQDGDAALDIYRTTDSSVATGAYRFYLANMEGVDPNIRRVYYDVTPSALFTGTMPYRVRVTATTASFFFQRYTADGQTDGAALPFSFSTATGGVELAVVAVTPQHDDARLSRIVYLNRQVNNWYYYHGVPEIYVSEPVDIVADEDAFSYNGRDSANFQSPPHVGYASALVRQHQSTDRPWFEELLNRNHVITGQRVHLMLRDADGNYGKDFTGILQSPPLQHQDNIYDWRVTLQDPTTLMVQSFANSATLLGPQDAISARTVGALIRTVCQAYADRTAGLTLDDVLDPEFEPDHFPVPLAWFWTDYESERDILQRLVNTQGPPTGFYVNNLGQLTFTGCEDRADPIQVGGAAGIPVSQMVSFSDHVVDVANDARIPVSLHGWVLPDIATTPAQIYEDPTGLPEAVQVQLFETYSDNAIFDLARGGGITFDANGEYRYRVRTGAPVLPTEAGFRITGASGGVTVNQVAANLLEIVATGAAGADVPAFQLLGAELKHFRTIENWTSQTVREENQTRFSRYLYHQREFSYGGYNSIAVRDAQLLADWVVRYYRKGIKTMTLQLFCSNHVQEALRLEPDRTPVRVAHNYGAGAPEQWIVRSRKRVYRDGHFWIEVVLDEDVMYSLGLEHSPLCAAYVAPDPARSATYAVGNAGELTYTGTVGAALAIPQQGFLSAAPDLAATVLPIAQAADTTTVLTHYSGVPLFQISGDFISAHFDLTRLEALNDSAFYADGLRANGLSLWLVEPKVDGDPYWAVAAFNFRADGFDGELPAAFHFLRVRYAALGAHSDVVLSFVAPNTTIHDVANHWITVAQEQPWLDEDAAAALLLHQHVIILDWQAFPMDAPVGFAGLLESPAYVNDAVVSADASPSTNVGGADGSQIARRFGRA